MTGENRDNETGFTLVPTLWMLAIIASLAATFSYYVKVQTRASHAEASLLRQTHRLEAAIAEGIYSSQAQGLNTHRIDDEGWAHLLSCRAEQAIEVAVFARDEAGRVDLNTADDRLIIAVLNSAGLLGSSAQRQLDRIVDFRDTDNLTRTHGAEAADYVAAKLSYSPKNSDFQTVDELQQVLGISPKLFLRARPHLTVATRQVGIDPAHAALPIMRVLVSGAGADYPNVGQWSRSQLAAHVPPELRVHSEGNHLEIVATEKRTDGSRSMRSASIQINRVGRQKVEVKSWYRGGGDAVPKAEAWDRKRYAELPSCRF